MSRNCLSIIIIKMFTFGTKNKTWLKDSIRYIHLQGEVKKSIGFR